MKTQQLNRLILGLYVTEDFRHLVITDDFGNCQEYDHKNTFLNLEMDAPERKPVELF